MQHFIVFLCLLSTASGVQFPDRRLNRNLEVELPRTPCQMKQSEDIFKCGDMIGCKITSCDPDGTYAAKQCHGSTGYCACVNFDGNEIEGTSRGPTDERGPIDCDAARRGDDLSDNAMPEVAAASNKRNLEECAENSDCLFYGFCGPTGRCECAEACPLNYAPVCGSNGETYPNECELNAEACRNQVEINVAYKQPCEIDAPLPSQTSCDELECFGQGETCVESDGEAKCSCSSVCNDEYEPVCGDNGKTYANECLLDVAACKIRSRIVATKMGPCEGGE